MRSVILVMSLVFATPVCAEAQWFDWPSKPAEKAAPPKKPAPAPAAKPKKDVTVTKDDKPVEAAPPAEAKADLYVALFTTSHKLWWHGRVTGQIRFSGNARSRMRMIAECSEPSTPPPCRKWVFEEEVQETRPSMEASYISFVANSRTVVWPHIFVVSDKPFTFTDKPVLEKW